MEVRSELHCHECDFYVQFTYDDGLNGNHVIECPKCGHEHCRVIQDGKITSDRWDSRNQNSYACSAVQYTAISIEMSVYVASSSIELTSSWIQTAYATGSKTTS